MCLIFRIIEVILFRIIEGALYHDVSNAIHWEMAEVFRYSYLIALFLTAKEGLLPPKYAFVIDLTYAESETKYSRSVRAYYEIASLSFY